VTDVTEFADARTFLALLPFVRELGINVVAAAPGAVIVEMPYAERFSTPPNHFPASFVGVLGDVAAASSCISRLPKGWAGATLDYIVKMTGRAQGERLLARGRVLQAGQTISVGAADVFAIFGGREVLCGAVLATTRNFEVKV
jgi:acyl-coenzyme A thioesterase PaaI-like protein